MLDKIFNTNDSIEIRCIHKDQTRQPNGKYDPSLKFFWGTYEQLRKKSKQFKKLNDSGYNIYFGANPRVGKSTKDVACCNTLFVDLDDISYSDAVDQLQKVQEKYSVPAPTLCVLSGGGVHFYWKLAEPVTDLAKWTNAQKRFISAFKEFAVTEVNDKGKTVIVSGIDTGIHDAPRIMRLVGFKNHKRNCIATLEYSHGDTYKAKDFAGLPLLVVAENKNTGPAYSPDAPSGSDNYSRACKYFSLREGTGKGNRNNEAFKIAIACINDFELSDNDSLNILSSWNLKNSPTLPYPDLEQIIHKANSTAKGKMSGSKNKEAPVRTKTKPVIESMEYQAPEDHIPNNISPIRPDVEPKRKSDGADFAVVAQMVAQYVLVIGTTDVWDLENGIMMPTASLRLQYPNEYKYWLRDFNRQIIMLEDLVFRPDEILKEGQINTFRGFDFKRDERMPNKLLEHIEFLCNDNEGLFFWVISWMAIQVQRPGTKLATSIIMHGKQGTGKSMLWQCFGKLFGEYFTTINQSLLESSFNQWASRKTFVLAEEVLANRSKSKLKNIIKEMITGGKIIIDQKYTKPWQEDCYMNMVFLSNNKLPMLLDVEDRRFTVIRCDTVREDEYYTDLAAEIADNGPNRLYHFLMNWNLDGFNAHSKPFQTTEKFDLIALAKDSAKLFLDDWTTNSIDGLGFIACLRSELYDAYREWCKAGNYRISMKIDFYATIRNDYPEIKELKYQGAMCFSHDKAIGNCPTEFTLQLKKFLKRLASNFM